MYTEKKKRLWKMCTVLKHSIISAQPSWICSWVELAFPGSMRVEGFCIRLDRLALSNIWRFAWTRFIERRNP